MRRQAVHWLRFGTLVLAVLGATTWFPSRAGAEGLVVLQRPVPGAVERPFQPPAQRWDPGHRGVDLAASAGDAVLAPADGVVSFAQNLAGRPVVSIQLSAAPGYRTTLEPVRAIVAVGERVVAGQVVGFVESATSRGSGPGHRGLHWGLRFGDRYVDPLTWTTGRTDVRLVPHDAAPIPVPGAPGSQTSVSVEGAVRPAEGPITSPFGMRLHPILQVWKLHDGVDIGAPCGAGVRSALPGTVTFAGFNTAYGNRVIVDHGQVGGHHLVTAYNHLAVLGASVGARVTAGSPVGTVGSTGWSTGCHLHLMSWVDGQVADPTPLVS